ncbi:MAG: chemotaxis protein CheB [Fervidobacterium sp.]|nr:chemotaxis protein CheB [Fervidobacterium sp.]
MLNKVIVVGSAGSPNVAIRIVKIDMVLNIPIIVCIHFTGSAMETFANHIILETGHNVIVVQKPTELKPGIYLPEGGKDLIFLSENIVNSVESEKTVHPSISKLFQSLVKYGSNNTTIIVLGGLGDDGREYAKILKDKGVRFIIEKSPRFPYLPENISKELDMRYEKLEIEEIIDVIKNLNTKLRHKI